MVPSLQDAPPGVRSAGLNDAVEIARLCRELGYPASEDQIRDRLAVLLGLETQCLLVAPGPGTTLLGWIAAEHRHRLESGESAAIVGLVVDETGRRRGIGRALVTAVAHWAAARGLTRMTVRSDVTRTASHAFYRSVGFAATKTQHTYVRRLFPE